MSKHNWKGRILEEGVCQHCGSTNNEFQTKSTCKPCRRLQKRSLRYGIPMEEVIDLLKIDNCEICNKELTTTEKFIDHDHETGRVRGVLCQNCNTGLGLFCDDISHLTNAIKYLNERTKIN